LQEEKISNMWVYLSPHLDDAVYSCGGLIWEQTQAGQDATVWTIFAGDPPARPLSPFAEAFHTRWGFERDAVSHRREEDRQACALVGAEVFHHPKPECIYRRDEHQGIPLYPTRETLNGELSPGDDDLKIHLLNEIKTAFPSNISLVCPLGLGNHVDHQLTRQVAEQLNYPLWYYADFPYVVRRDDIKVPDGDGWTTEDFPVSEVGLEVWGDAVAIHSSQLKTFWDDESTMRTELHRYWMQMNGVRLWRKKSG